MLRRLQRPAAVLVPALLLAPVLAACGSDGGSAKAPSGSGAQLEQVSFSGAVGKALKPTWRAKVPAPSSAKVTTLVKGTGDKIASGDTVSTYVWVGNGTTKKAAYSDYQNGSPESVPVDSKLSALFQKLFKGATYGSRVAAVAPSKDLFGATGGSQLGVGAKDTVVLVADMVKKAAVSPTPSSDKVQDVAPGKLPKVVSKGGKPTSLDFSGVSEPSTSTPVQRVVLKKGTGAAVSAADTVTVNYLGAVYKAKTPFDESYSKGQPLTSPLSGLVKGWAIGLDGVKVGSRVLIQIPPAFGYGAQGSGATIPPNSTLWFVIDVQKATKG
ncbi:FKBP-type peptidyl-prolyl cis-trans isomerase [Nocardioides korecus]